MKVLFIHNLYQNRGGEDSVVASEQALLQAKGHEVLCYQRCNEELQRINWLRAGIGTVWASPAYHELKRLLASEKPDVAHFHNTFPLISPAGYYACTEFGVPVIQTLHNYRLVCPAATFLRNGGVCEECLGRPLAWPGVVHACYRKNRIATAAVAVMLSSHRALRTWQDKVDLYVALSEFARQKFIQEGLPQDRIAVKPNFVASHFSPRQGPGEFALYLGRLSEEKGLASLLAAWTRLRETVPLHIAGDGPLMQSVAEDLEAKRLQNVKLLGRLTPADVTLALQRARFLICPSICYETFGLAVAEAFACGVPVIASRLGSLAEIVTEGVTGLFFPPGDPVDLAAKVNWAWTHPQEMEAMGRRARVVHEMKYTAERNYEKFVELWKRIGIDVYASEDTPAQSGPLRG